MIGASSRSWRSSLTRVGQGAGHVRIANKMGRRWAVALMTALLQCFAAASAKEATSDQTGAETVQPSGGSKPVATITIKRCPTGYELVTRANGRPGCTKDILPPIE